MKIPGFFTKEETKIKSLRRGCASCGLIKGCLTPRMKPSGEGKQKWLVIAEAPGEEEDSKGTQLIGKAGKLWSSKLVRYGVSSKRDFRRTNAIRCRPPKNRAPKPHEIASCRHHIWKEVKKNPPKAVFLLGAVAIEAWWGDRLSDSIGPIGKWRGVRIPDRDHQCWVFHLFHPSYVLRSEHYNPGIEITFDLDLRTALATANDPLPPLLLQPAITENDRVQILDDPKSALRWLRKIPPGALLTVDWETTGLKPWNKGHDILCAGFSLDGKEAVAIPLEHPKVRIEVAKQLDRRDIYLCAHHIQFEDMWSRKILGNNPKHWVWDTMLAAHLLDNRTGITGAKWQAFIRYGIIDYDKEIDPWKKSKEGTNGFNQLRERMKHPEDRRKVLTYAGLDALFESRMAFDQMEEMGRWPWD